MSVHDQEDFARVYDEDEVIPIRKGDLRALLDIASTSLDFGSGFLNDEEVEILRTAAVVLGVDPMQVTPSNHFCKYQAHVMQYVPPQTLSYYIPPRHQPGRWGCVYCGLEDFDRPAPTPGETDGPLRVVLPITQKAPPATGPTSRVHR